MVAKSLIVRIRKAVFFMSTSMILFMFSTSKIHTKDRLHRMLFCFDEEVSSF